MSGIAGRAKGWLTAVAKFEVSGDFSLRCEVMTGRFTRDAKRIQGFVVRPSLCVRIGQTSLWGLSLVASCGQELPILSGDSTTSMSSSSESNPASSTDDETPTATSELSATSSLSSMSSSESGTLDEESSTATSLDSSTSSSSTTTTSSASNSDDSTASSSEESSDSTTSSDTTSTVPKKSDGDFCAGDVECASAICGLMSRCGACRDDAQCQALGQSNCTLNAREVPICSSGRLGEVCQSGTACASTICNGASATARGICSECQSSAQCRTNGLGNNCTFSAANAAAKPWWRCSQGELGERCRDAEDCASTICHAHPLLPKVVGICSSCRDDAQCQSSGVGRNCIAQVSAERTFATRASARPSVAFACSQGNLGEACANDLSCLTPLRCAPWGLAHTGAFGICSSCTIDADCPSETPICSLRRDRISAGSPAIDRLNCVAADAQAHATWCSPKSSATPSDACVGFCVALPHDASNLLGLCGECRLDPTLSDCPSGKKCVPPRIDPLNGPQGSRCE